MKKCLLLAAVLLAFSTTAWGSGISASYSSTWMNVSMSMQTNSILHTLPWPSTIQTHDPWMWTSPWGSSNPCGCGSGCGCNSGCGCSNPCGCSGCGSSNPCGNIGWTWLNDDCGGCGCGCDNDCGCGCNSGCGCNNGCDCGCDDDPDPAFDLCLLFGFCN